MTLGLKDLPAKIAPLLGKAKSYAVFIFVIGFLAIYGFVVFRINMLSRVEPDESAITEKVNSVQRPRIDQATLDKIQQLRSENIEVKSLFDHARDNPFNE